VHGSCRVATARRLRLLDPLLANELPAGGPRKMNSYGKLASEIISSPRVTIQQTENRWQLMGLVFIALGAVALRSMWLLRRGEPWAMTPDSVGYLALAHGLLHGCGFAVWTRGICGVPEMVRTPGYPVFIAFFGCDWRAVIFVQAVLGGLLVLGLGLFAWRHFGFRAALLATLSLATDVPSILVTKEILTEASFQFVLGAGFLLLASAALSGAENRAGPSGWRNSRSVPVASLCTRHLRDHPPQDFSRRNDRDSFYGRPILLGRAEPR
jgi:hypothetical protein